MLKLEKEARKVFLLFMFISTLYFSRIHCNNCYVKDIILFACPYSLGLFWNK